MNPWRRIKENALVCVIPIPLLLLWYGCSRKQETVSNPQRWDHRHGQRADDPEEIAPEMFKVFVTPAGKKYHREDCSRLARSKNVRAVTLAEAQARLEPCRVCKPPAVVKK